MTQRIVPCLALAVLLAWCCTPKSWGAEGEGPSSEIWELGEDRVFQEALLTLEHYLRAGVADDVQGGAKLTTDFRFEPRRATYDTGRLYKRHEDLLSKYVTASSLVYGYEFSGRRSGTKLHFQGGIETLAGIEAEYDVQMVYRHQRWMIKSISIE